MALPFLSDGAVDPHSAHAGSTGSTSYEYSGCLGLWAAGAIHVGISRPTRHGKEYAGPWIFGIEFIFVDMGSPAVGAKQGSSDSIDRVRAAESFNA